MIEKIAELIKTNSYSDGETLFLGGLLEIKMFNNETGFGVDIYKAGPEEKPEDYDYDSDYITTVYL